MLGQISMHICMWTVNKYMYICVNDRVGEKRKKNTSDAEQIPQCKLKITLTYVIKVTKIFFMKQVSKQQIKLSKQ